MEDLDFREKPYKVGDRLIVELVVTDVNKSFDFLGKAILNKLDTSEFGFDVEKVSFWKDRYVDHIPLELREEIAEKLQVALNEVRELLEVY